MSLTYNERARVAAVAVLHKDSVLLGKRIETYKGEPQPYGGYWSIFGGTLEEGENPMVGAIRELKEETEIELSITDIAYIKTIENEECSFTVYGYQAPRLIHPVLNFEHTEYGWFLLNSLSNFTEKIDPKLIECINHYKKNLYPE